jgi:2'-5' RNA ligase
MRCFIGLPLPQVYQDALGEIRRELARGLRSKLTWTRPGNWHATLKFLGEVEQARAMELAAALGELRFEVFSLRAGGAGFFPDIRRPRVFWAGLAEGAEEGARLAAAMDDLCAGLGFEREGRPFKAHLTLARIKRAARDDWREMIRTVASRDWPEVEMDRVVLWKSDLSSAGPAYTSVCEVRADRRGN